MSREVEFCHRDRLIELGLTMTWEEREGEQDVRMRRSAVQAQQNNRVRHEEPASQQTLCDGLLFRPSRFRTADSASRRDRSHTKTGRIPGRKIGFGCPWE